MGNRFTIVNRNMLLKRSCLYQINTFISNCQVIGLRLSSSASTAVHSNVDKIKIPKRIERGPTDILQALSDTVKKDYTASHYKYHDDPYLIPTSNLSKRSFSLAKESGRKAARYFLDKYPELFYNDPAEPKIEAFTWKEVYDENTDVDEGDLKKCIFRNEVSNCVTIYKNMKSKDKFISNETLQDLLELVCFFNSEDPLTNDYLEELWFQQRLFEQRKTWRNKSFAEDLFQSMEKTSQTYCALIQGMTKYMQAQQAYELYEEMKNQGFSCNVETYNSLIRVISYLRESSESRWGLAEEFLNNMKTEGILPNLGTFNSLLELISKFNFWKYARPLAQKTCAEMRTKMGIEPSLATYYYLLTIFCKDKGPVCPILYEIVDEIENKKLIARDKKDVCFFNTAMDVCLNHLFDVQLAYRVNNLLNYGNNYKLLGESLRESIYFQKFFKLLSTAEDTDILMEIYNKYVPHVYTPEISVINDIIEAIELNRAYHFLPQIWTDLVLFNYYNKGKAIFPFLKVLAKEQVEDELQKQFVKIVWDAIERIDYKPQEAFRPVLSSSFEWTGESLDNCLNVFLNGGDFEKAFSVIKKLETQQSKIAGHPTANTLMRFCLENLKLKEIPKALQCVRYANDIGLNEVNQTILNQWSDFNLEDDVKELFVKLQLSAESSNENI